MELVNQGIKAIIVPGSGRDLDRRRGRQQGPPTGLPCPSPEIIKKNVMSDLRAIDDFYPMILSSSCFRGSLNLLS